MNFRGTVQARTTRKTPPERAKEFNMARLTKPNTTKAVPAASTSRKSETKAASTSRKSETKPMTVNFTASVKHISTSGHLAVFDGRKEGGPDLYVNLADMARAFGYLPEGVDVQMVITPKGKAASNVLAVVPRTMQNRFEEGKADFEDIYGKSVSEHMTELLTETPKTSRMAAGDKAPAKTSRMAAGDKVPAKSEHGEAASLADKVNSQGAAIDQLAAMMLKIAKKIGA